MVNDEVSDPVVPSEVITWTLYTPGVAESGIARVQLIEVDPLTAGFVQGICVNPSEETRFTSCAFVKVCPLRVRVYEDPGFPLVGVILLIVGDARPMVNALISDMDCPSGLMTWIFAGPAFRPVRLTEQVICVEVTETPEAVTGWSPGWIRRTVAPFTKLLPVIVRETLVPIAPVVGDTVDAIGPLPEGVVVTAVGTVGVA